MAYDRRQYKGNVSYTDQLSGGISNSATTLTLKDGSTFPDGAVGPFYITIDPGVAGSEEKVKCASRSGAVVTVAASGRGADGTSAVSHSANAVVIHTISAVDLDEANQAVHNTLGAITTTGDILYATSSTTLGRLGIGSAGEVLAVSGGVPAWVAGIDSNSADITVSAMGDAVAAGSVGKFADAGHRHGRESFAVPAIVLGTVAAAGVAATPIRSDATIVAFDATAPTTSAVGDSAAAGAAAVAARRDHTHGREAFGASATTSAVGDAEAPGTAATPSRSDHKHGREAFFSGTPAQDSTAGAAGTATTVSHGDHAHTDGDTGWTQPALGNSWAQSGTTNSAYGARLVGKVAMIRGKIGNGATGTTAFTLAASMRPAQTLQLATIDGAGASCYVTVNIDGTVQPNNIGTSDVHGNGVWVNGTWLVG